MANTGPDERGIFNAARKIADPSERRLYLEKSCAGNEHLIQRMEALLHAYEQDPDFLEAAIADPSINQPGTMIGRYKLLELIGQGGMGEVWMAEQRDPVKRLVALKLIKSGRDSRLVMARFDAERQALALMDHPNIAKVFDAGESEDGLRPRQPYFVMELVKGKSITHYCDENRLSLQARLALFVPVCNAIHHAHQKGIIHRDIKPNNVLIGLYDGHPVPKVIDFGVAKATGLELTEMTLHTNFGTVVGTPQYMSPEQAEVNQLDVDTRSDIYSLGVLLYELLTGSTPFEQGTLARAGLLEMLRMIREDDPPIPSTRLSSANALPSIAANRCMEPKRLTAIMRGELDWMVMKSLEKDRSRRYSSARDLARDVERYLAGEAVEAGPLGTTYRLRKLARRYRAVLATTAAFAFVLILGTAISIWLAIRATNAERDAKRDRDAIIAEKQRGDTEAAVALAVNEFLRNELLGQADIANQSAGERNRNVTVRELLDRAAIGIDRRFQDQPATEAAIRLTLGNAYRAVADLPQAQKQVEKSLALRREKSGPRDPMTLQAMHALANIMASRGEHTAAEKMYREILALREADLGGDHPDTLASRSDLGVHLIACGKFDESEKYLQLAHQGRMTILGAAHPNTIETVNGIANLHFARGQYSAAAEYFQQASAGFRAALGRDHPYTISSMGSLASCYLSNHQFEKAEQLMQEVLAIKREKMGPDHPDTLDTMQNLALLYQEQKRFDEAEALYKKVLEGRRAKQDVDHPDTLQTMNNFATCYVARGQFESAEVLYRQVLAALRKKFGPDHPETIVTLHNLAVFYRDRRRFDEARPLFLEALQGARKAWGLGHPNTHEVFANLAMLHTRQGNPEPAEALLRELVAFLKDNPGPESYAYANQLANLTMILVRQKKFAEAEPFARECLVLRTKYRPEHWSTFLSKALVGAALLGQNKLADAEPLLVEGFQGMKLRDDQIPASAKPHIRDTVQRLVQLYETQGKKDEADRWRKQLPAGS